MQKRKTNLHDATTTKAKLYKESNAKKESLDSTLEKKDKK